MKYKILNTNNIIDYLKGIESVAKYFGKDNLTAKEIGDGNLNFVFLVSSTTDSSKALIVKQAVPYIRCLGEEYLLKKERMTYEIRSLRIFDTICPDFVVKLYHTCETMSVIVMRYLDNHNVLRTSLIDKIKYKKFSEHISTYLSNVLFGTSSLCLSSEQKSKQIQRFNNNSEMCKLTEDYVFTFAFMEHVSNDDANIKDNALADKIFDDMELKEKVLQLKYKYMNHTDCLLHGDLHTGSVMLNKHETYVIDSEFAFVGPFGFDIGVLLANLTSSYAHHSVVTKDEKYKSWILKTIYDIWTMFEYKFLKLWDETNDSALVVDGFINNSSLKNYKNNFMKDILRQSVGFAGCEILRRVFGAAGVDEIRAIDDKDLRKKAELLVFDIGRKFVLQHNDIENIDEIINNIILVEKKDKNRKKKR